MTSLSRLERRLQKKYNHPVRYPLQKPDEPNESEKVPVPLQRPRMKRLTFLIKADLGEFGELFRRQLLGRGT